MINFFRLALTSESNLMISDMKFFEPSRGTESFEIYKSNISHSQVNQD